MKRKGKQIGGREGKLRRGNRKRRRCEKREKEVE
jgi:hypothetical protein